MSDPLWYKDAIIYEAHVRAFFDSTGDGIGDFAGFTQKLPYLNDLGVTCIWLLPFYPSPLRDDGYDIADYTSINPMYGTLDEFKRFLDAAHALNIRVLTELVINHTSDQHPWFQRARRAPKGSSERNYYVWSDTDTKYSGTRIIFVDTEKSNWTLDPVAGQYYWHRFFSHQPDLNFDNPTVLEALLDVMRFWLDMGVDALRLDAIPYLIEREGTINENLPETHDILKQIRRALDARYSGRVLLAEANQWPSDVRAYFGDGDECHMAFHFPLMPRIFMGLRQEERHPIVEIMNQTPEIPEACQWAIFLRNHDELTLEMVTDEERDYMYSQYAADPEMRLNVGIRRRLAPLMENSRPRIELMNSLLFSMPGTPIIYYGDEIGMGDNVYLGDRNGVRTPMQWSSDRNAGFSRADPARLYFPVIMDPVYGYEAINVEAQERSPFSLLHWMKRMIALRRQHPVFGRGSIEFIRTGNRKVLTYVRRDESETILCVANLSRVVQPVEIPLAQFAGLTPVELLGQTQLPKISDQPYFLTLAPYGFYWLRLQEAVVPTTSRIVPVVDEHPSVPSLFAGVVWDATLDGSMRGIIEKQALVPFLERQRWFGGKARPVTAARFVDWTTLRRGAHPAFLSLVEVQYRDGAREHYVLPLAMASGPEAETVDQQHGHAVLSRITGARKGLLYDGLFDDGVCSILLEVMRRSGEIKMRNGRIQGIAQPALGAVTLDNSTPPLIRRPADQSNTSVLFAWQLIMKIFRRVEPGVNPDVEIGAFLSSRGFSRVPPLVAALTYEHASGDATSMVMLQRFVSNQGNAWDVTIEELGRYFDRVKALPPAASATDAEVIRPYLARAELLGRRTGELHVALASASRDEPAFTAEAFSAADLTATARRMREGALEQLRLLESALPQLDDRRRQLASELLMQRDELAGHFDAITQVRSAGTRIRCHGDYHLGQVLVAEADVVILDFEGEPARPLIERRQKCSPLRDVAGMLRSFSYAALTSLDVATHTRSEDLARLTPWARLWETWVSSAFRHAYLAATEGTSLVPRDPDDFDTLLRVFVVEKALYELAYELNNRPDWAHIPLMGLLNLRSLHHA
ncbi:MAG TPA: maltose alpha-D-glucosyltransferase [Vicinamibacterales bacterium]|nr:maltose alpha-D-glucosyltransferase [Vicinamibacterales bacterium]